MLTGTILAVFCNLLVWTLGYRLVSTKPMTGSFGSMFSWGWRFVMRSILGIASVALIVVGFVLTASSHNPQTWQIYSTWLVLYVAGVTVYFVVRYGHLSPKKVTR